MKPFLKWVRELSVRSKFSIIIALIMLILIFGLLNFWLSMKIMSGVRAYVGGEGLWSKAQKEAVNNLLEYAIYKDPKDYENYLKFLQVPLGDKKARLEMDKENPDYNVVHDGFIQGGNSNEDIENLIFLYENFQKVSYMRIAIEDWRQGDEEIENLMVSGNQIHALVSSATDSSQPIPALRPILAEVFETDRKLTALEDHFSATLSEGSRWIRNVLTIVTLVLTIILGSVALLVAFYIGKIMEEVDRFKSEFVSMASHELRTPMAAIKGFVAMILGGRYGKIDAQLRRPLENVSVSMERLIKLSNDLLDAAKIESQGLKPKIKSCRSDILVKEVVKDSVDVAKTKGVKIETLELDKSMVKCDEGQLLQILHNLIGNAVKFTEKGKISISSIALGKMQFIYVKDTGIGISKSDHQKVFLKFQQITPDSGYKPQGSGLGLYISQRLAEKMGGSLSLEGSEVGKGSTFVLTLPISAERV